MLEKDTVKSIVTTTIHRPTEALRRFAAMKGWTLIVIGDKKTPLDWYIPGAIYVTPENQDSYDHKLSEAIGWNCVQRRNFGLLLAKGSDIVAIVDDDNIPYEGWGENLMIGQETSVNYYTTDLPAFDPVGATNYTELWHRGFPLELLPKRDYTNKQRICITPDVQADFWDGDPDIDAVCRMEYAPECVFQKRYFPIASNAISPFNSQNTFISGKFLKDYFMFPETGRMNDIWASYYVQAKGACVVYGEASVRQHRNEHDVIEDMKQEYIGYEHNLEIVKALCPTTILSFLSHQALQAFELYQKHF